MAQVDTTPDTETPETRELAWELQQERPDVQRVRLFLEQDANLRTAMRLANVGENDLLKRPALKPLQLQRRLHPSS